MLIHSNIEVNDVGLVLLSGSDHLIYLWNDVDFFIWEARRRVLQGIPLCVQNSR